MGASVFASVIFLKVQEYARRPASEQARLRAQLEAVVAVTASELDPSARIVLDASDGVAIVVLRDPAGALRLAEQAMTAAAAGLPLSGGINHGAVEISAGNGKKDRGKKDGGKKGGGPRGMAGDGIAVAASVAEFASPSRLLASRAFRDALADRAPGREAALVRAGTFADAGLRVHEIFVPDPRAIRRRSQRYLAIGVLAVFVFLGAGIGVRIGKDGQEAFVAAALAKYQSAAAQGRGYLNSLFKKPRR